jgi:hypothetical protein
LSKAKLVWKSGFRKALSGTMTEEIMPVSATEGDTVEKGVTETMLKSPVWLVGHSYPARWVEDLEVPLDPRHPTRNSIWTPVLDCIQQEVYRGDRRRFDMDKAFVFNAAEKQAPRTDADWSPKAMSVRSATLEAMLKTYRPPIVITFGRDVYHFVMKANGSPVAKSITAQALGKAFNKTVDEYAPHRVNVIPLLHQHVAMGGWIAAGLDYSPEAEKRKNANYFSLVGTALGRILLTHGKDWPIWVE